MSKIKLMNMKWLVILLCLPFVTSCLEDLPAYEEAEITKVGFFHRFAGPNKDAVTGEPIMVEKELTCTSDINSEAATVNVKVTVPVANGDFTDAERAKVVQGKLWGYLTVATASRVSPLSGTSALGTPDDWTKEHQFEVMAADGTKKVWTVKVTEFNR